ncbi:hypothetical protein NCS57_00944500 [Fusarium keratoplasticum]|uniref:Uncharacterized protein n=1 Tax=Fusarium keratoplasticum TaxID=1328300 RepID=A0ACC0QSE8_9HYPO|nr:hypothetical protein NCS57_00944500 [Fusarium keratoplasticum]KAI8663437.1 hypothetical protein NCS57_00944500 [Fusarium keratoplasticum]
MPRMADLALHDSPAYQRYLEGEPENPGTVKRWSGLRPFERDEQGRIILPLGERFCRMPHRGGDGIQLCSKVHIRLAHKEVIAPAHKGASPQAEIDDASNYYTLLVARLTGADDGESEIITPRKASGENEVV